MNGCRLCSMNWWQKDSRHQLHGNKELSDMHQEPYQATFLQQLTVLSGHSIFVLFTAGVTLGGHSSLQQAGCPSYQCLSHTGRS